MSTDAAMPAPAVLALTAAVLAAHVWLLQRGPPSIQPTPAVRPAAFAIRSIAATPTAAPPVAAPAAAPHTARSRARAMERSPATLPLRQRPAAAALRGVEPGDAMPAPPAEGSAAAPGAGARISIPPPMLLRYQLTARAKQRPVEGTSELAWRHDGGSYEARFEVAAADSPARVQHSAGGIDDAGLHPVRFGDRSRGEQAAHFDREGRRVVFSNNRPAVPLAAGAQDRLSVLLQLAALVAGDPGRFPTGATVVLQTATTREAQAWVFTVEGEERLELPGGELVALKLTRPPQGEFDQRVEVWLAPGQAYVPVRLRLTQRNGDWADHQWSATDRP